MYSDHLYNWFCLCLSHSDRRGGAEEEGSDPEEEGGGGGAGGAETSSEWGADADHQHADGGASQDLRRLLLRLRPIQGQSRLLLTPS